MGFDSTINKFMSDNFNEIPVANISNSKIIHLTNIGTHNFKPHEIALIDTPLIQRLKFISQLGPSYYVFPTARHSRFEHSLGVTIMISQMFKSLSDNSQLKFLTNLSQKEKLLNELRVAALAHDIGHGPFSHVSEVVMEEYSDTLHSETLKLSCKCHEAIGYHVIKSDSFKQFFDDISKFYGITLNPDEIANLIIGNVNNPEEEQFKADLLNGEFDADKLDYIIRDSYFSGVQLALGIDRFLLSLGIENIQTKYGNKKKLILTEKGIMAMEQIVIGKIMLHEAIYHHQKVRAIDQMIIALLRMILTKKPEINGEKIETPIDLLKLDDYDILKLQNCDGKINALCKSLKNRKTFKRALVISPKTMILGEDPINSDSFWDVLKYGEFPQELRKLNRILAERIGYNCTEFDVAIDIPKPPELKETTQKLIKNIDRFTTIKDIFPQKEWLDAYIANKWSGHIFAVDDYRKSAQKEGQELLEETFHIEFNENAKKFAKINPPYKNNNKNLFDFNFS